jgi:uncharacterized protein (UPF0332 family)
MLSRDKGGVYEEALLRTAVSRAYYSGFNKAKEYAEINHSYEYTRGGKTGRHQHLINFLSGLNDNDKKIAAGLQRCKLKRVHCDYYNPYPSSDSDSDSDLREVYEEVELDIKEMKKTIVAGTTSP